MGRIEEAKQINAIYQGKMKVNDALPDVQAWFEISVYSLALGIANAPKDKRKQVIEDMKKTNPDWVDDVLPIARELCTQENKTN